MGRIQALKSYFLQAAAVVEELQETVNLREKKTRIKELKAYLSLISSLIEREENEIFRTDPKDGLKRALLRADSLKTNEQKKEDKENTHDLKIIGEKISSLLHINTSPK